MLSRKVFVSEWEGGRAMLVLAETVVAHFEATDSCPGTMLDVYLSYLSLCQAGHIRIPGAPNQLTT